MVLRIANRQRRPDQRIELLADATSDHFRTNRIGADQTIRPMLLGRADGYDNAAAVSQPLFHFLPGTKM